MILACRDVCAQVACKKPRRLYLAQWVCRPNPNNFVYSAIEEQLLALHHEAGVLAIYSIRTSMRHEQVGRMQVVPPANWTVFFDFGTTPSIGPFPSLLWACRKRVAEAVLLAYPRLSFVKVLVLRPCRRTTASPVSSLPTRSARAPYTVFARENRRVC
jgi:hypothetical protein